MNKQVYIRHLEKRDVPAIVDMEERQTRVARPDFWEKRIEISESAEDHGITTTCTLITSNQTEMQQFFSRLGFIQGKMLHYQKELST